MLGLRRSLLPRQLAKPSAHVVKPQLNEGTWPATLAAAQNQEGRQRAEITITRPPEKLRLT